MKGRRALMERTYRFAWPYCHKYVASLLVRLIRSGRHAKVKPLAITNLGCKREHE
jgi:hypothetical protein